jgi:hypothetical protein
MDVHLKDRAKETMKSGTVLFLGLDLSWTILLSRGIQQMLFSNKPDWQKNYNILKFPGDIDTVMARVNKIDDLDTRKKIKKAIKTARDISEIWY